MSFPPDRIATLAEAFLKQRADHSRCHAEVRAYTYAEVLEVIAAFGRQVERYEIALGALADIACSEDMTLTLAQRKAKRIYDQFNPPTEQG
jgi:predicted metal-dependent hydrolase